MSKTKQKILDSARVLFNERGYANTTIRMIANELGMSSGNLNYHFKTKESLLEALYFEMVAAFDQRIKDLPQTEFSIQSMYKEVLDSMHRMVDYRFFWLDMYFILKSNQRVKEHFEQVYIARFKGYEFLFERFADQGIMTSFETEIDKNALIEQMLVFSNCWIYQSALYNLKLEPDFIKNQALHLIRILTPYLSKTAKKRLNELSV